MKVLYVEDDADSRKLIQRILGSEGIDVVLAENGPRAIELIKKEAFDAIILDIMMPGIDGIQVGKVIRKEAVDPGVPILLLTAHPYALREAVARSLNPVAAMTKPPKREKLVQALRDAVAARNQ